MTSLSHVLNLPASSNVFANLDPGEDVGVGLEFDLRRLRQRQPQENAELVSIANNKNTSITLGFILSALETDVDDLVKKKYK